MEFELVYREVLLLLLDGRAEALLAMMVRSRKKLMVVSLPFVSCRRIHQKLVPGKGREFSFFGRFLNPSAASKLFRSNLDKTQPFSSHSILISARLSPIQLLPWLSSLQSNIFLQFDIKDS